MGLVISTALGRRGQTGQTRSARLPPEGAALRPPMGVGIGDPERCRMGQSRQAWLERHHCLKERVAGGRIDTPYEHTLIKQWNRAVGNFWLHGARI